MLKSLSRYLNRRWRDSDFGENWSYHPLLRKYVHIMLYHFYQWQSVIYRQKLCSNSKILLKPM